MPAPRKLAPLTDDKSVTAYFEHEAREDLKPICYRLHELILEAAPDMNYGKKWAGPCYWQNWIVAMIVAEKDYVRFHVQHGPELHDPDGMLQGTGKGIRHIKLHKLSDIPESKIRDWIREELVLDLRDAGELPALAKPASAPAPAAPTTTPRKAAVPAKRAPVKKAAAKKKAPAKKAPAKKAKKAAPARKASAKKAKAAPAKKKAPAKKAKAAPSKVPKKAAAKRAAPKKPAAKKAKKAAPAKKKAAKKGRSR